MKEISEKPKRGMPDRGALFIYAFIAIMIGFGTTLAGGSIALSTRTAISEPAPATVSVLANTSDQKSSLNIQSFLFATPLPPTPTSVPVSTTNPTTAPPSSGGGGGGGTCPSVDGPRDNCTCLDPMSFPIDVCPNLSADQCAAAGGQIPVTAASFSWGKCSFTGTDMDGKPGCESYCEAKPVVYLYPTHNTFVDVSVRTQGQIVVSDPHYPNGGWKHVLAHPNGSLVYMQQSYTELFYETSVTYIAPPTAGFVIPVNVLQGRLTQITYQLGLNPAEQKEFLDFWMPRLQRLNSPYIFFSILDLSEKERTDHLDITPKPDTFVSFMAYFKPLSSEFSGVPILLLPKRPTRVGFTAVEWGGTIAPKNAWIE